FELERRLVRRLSRRLRLVRLALGSRTGRYLQGQTIARLPHPRDRAGWDHGTGTAPNPERPQSCPPLSPARGWSFATRAAPPWWRSATCPPPAAGPSKLEHVTPVRQRPSDLVRRLAAAASSR